MSPSNSSRPNFDPAGMDQAAAKAELELAAWLERASPDQINGIDYLSRWWEKWFMVAGHKRLGRVLVRRARMTGGG